MKTRTPEQEAWYQERLAKRREQYRADPKIRKRAIDSSREWRKAHPEQARATAKAYNQRPEVKKRKAEYQRRYAAAHPEKIRAIVEQRKADPVRYAHYLEWKRAYYKRKRAEKKAENVVSRNRP